MPPSDTVKVQGRGKGWSVLLKIIGPEKMDEIIRDVCAGGTLAHHGKTLRVSVMSRVWRICTGHTFGRGGARSGQRKLSGDLTKFPLSQETVARIDAHWAKRRAEIETILKKANEAT